jgi:hypothetical protein
MVFKTTDFMSFLIEGFKIHISFVGISGETKVFERMSVGILDQDGMCMEDPDFCESRIYKKR